MVDEVFGDEDNDQLQFAIIFAEDPLEAVIEIDNSITLNIDEENFFGDNLMVVVTARDPSGETDTLTFPVTVLPVNDPPFVDQPIQDQRNLVEDFGPWQIIDLDDVFDDVDDDQLQVLKQFVSLEELSLQATKITDKSLEHLRPLRQLRLLHLGQTRVTDAGLEQLKGLDRLRVLDLNHTRITDAGLSRLAEMPWLEAVSLSGNRLSQKAFDDLKKVLPNARVTR